MKALPVPNGRVKASILPSKQKKSGKTFVGFRKSRTFVPLFWATP